MRKFRVWDDDEKRYLVQGDFSLEVILNPEKFNCCVDQFTGLLDKNGKEIYEHDKVRVSQDPLFHGEHFVKFQNIFEGKVIYHNGCYWVINNEIKDREILGKGSASLSVFWTGGEFNSIEVL